jgi:hypothetical protein
MNDRLLYPYSEVMHKLGIGRTTLYGLIDTGRLACSSERAVSAPTPFSP